MIHVFVCNFYFDADGMYNMVHEGDIKQTIHRNETFKI